MQRLAAPAVWGAVLVGVAGAFVALRSHGGEEAFRAEQAGSLTLTTSPVLSASRVAALVAQAPEPVAAARRTPPSRVRCHAGGGGTLRNPWSCTIVYRSGTRAHYRVVVQPDGQYTGVGTGIITGCCIQAPTLE